MNISYRLSEQSCDRQYDDLPAVLPHTRNVAFLEDGEIARVTVRDVSYFREGRPMEKQPQPVIGDVAEAVADAASRFK